MATAISLPNVTAPPPVAAGSCTGWTSKTVPPETIRVLRTRSGKVQTVAFRRYVAEVMASGEWPSSLQRATLEAGAVATKQYAWYYALKGNHRANYRRNGKCYDVRDDSVDQIYRPERARPTAKQWAAIDATWGLSLRKRGRFFLTGYRQGTTTKCAADADGWRLYARSVQACARQGWSRERIQQRYYAPGIDYVWANYLGPTVRSPSLQLETGSTVAGGAVTVRWRPASWRSDVASYRLQRKIGNNAWKNVPLSRPKARSARVKVGLGKTNRFRVLARDSKGRRGPWAYSRKRGAAIRGPVGISLSGSDVDPSAGDPTVARIIFTGKSVAYVAPRGPEMGKAKILMGGRYVATIDLHSDVATVRELVWTRNFKSVRKHSIAVKPIDPGERVDFDGFFVLH